MWIYGAHLHLIPLSHVSAPSSKPKRPQVKSLGEDEDGLDEENEDYISVPDAIKVVRDMSVATQASAEIEKAVGKRIHG